MILLFSFFFLPATSWAKTGEEGELTWSCLLGRGEARFVEKTRDGGYAVTGWIESPQEGSAILLAKCDDKGKLLWNREFRGNGYSCGYCVKELREGGFILVGDTKSKHGYDHDVYVARTDEKGELLWEKNFGGSYCDYAWYVQQTQDGGFVLAGGTESYGAGLYDVYLIKLTPSGEKLWEKTYGGQGSDVGYAVLEVPGGGYLVAGSTESFGAGSTDVYLLRTDTGGNLLWQRTYGGRGADYCWTLQPALIGEGYLLAGEKEVAQEQGSIMVASLRRVDGEGNLLWEKTYGEQQPGAFYALWPLGDRGYLLAGKRELPLGYYGFYVVRVDKNGELLWEKTLDFAGGSCGYGLLEARDGGYILAGKRQGEKGVGNEAVLLKLREKRGGNALYLSLTTGIVILFILALLLFWRSLFWKGNQRRSGYHYAQGRGQ